MCIRTSCGADHSETPKASPSPLNAQLHVAHLLDRDRHLLLDALPQLEVELLSVLRNWTVEKWGGEERFYKVT